MGPSEIKELNEMLQDYVEVPRATSLLNLRYLGSPQGMDSSEDEDEEAARMLEELRSRASRYELDIS